MVLASNIEAKGVYLVHPELIMGGFFLMLKLT